MNLKVRTRSHKSLLCEISVSSTSLIPVLMLPFEFIVEGPPVSGQTRNRTRLRAWINTVRAEAMGEWPVGDQPVTDDLNLVVTNYYKIKAPDVDNILKPIQDALIGLVYDDDSRIVHTASKKKNLNGSYKLQGLSEKVADGLVMECEFIHVKIEQNTDQNEL